MSKPKLGDEQFLLRLEHHQGNMTALAKELGVSQPAIKKRRNRILAGKGKAQGRAAAIAAEIVEGPTPERPRGMPARTVVHVQRHIAEGILQYRSELEVMELLLENDAVVRKILTEILEEVQQRGGKSRPKERQQLLEIADRRERLARTLVDIQAKAHTAETLRAFIAIVFQVITREAPDVKQRLYLALRDAGPLLSLAAGLGGGPGYQDGGG